eukprot:SAG25_NODE_4098_length_890_cov_0.979772_2_plen_33_part_01
MYRVARAHLFQSDVCASVSIRLPAAIAFDLHVN